MMKKVGFGLIAAGLSLSAVSLLADFIGLGRGGGIQAAQLLGIEAGAVILLAGIGALTLKPSSGTDFQPAPRLAWDSLPVSTWVVISFLVAFIWFFAVPVFLNPDHQIQYLFKYVPEAGGQIGFDIRAIMERIDRWITEGQSPYVDRFVGYPPLALALFAPLLIIGYPGYFTFLFILTLASYIISSMVIPLLLAPKGQYFLPLFLACMGLFSYGLQFELERGQFNLIAFALCLLAIYIFHAHKRFRFFAYAIFTLSIQLKIYPVFLIFLFVEDWRNWKENILRMLGLGLANLSLLFVLGTRLFLDFLGTLSAYQANYQSSRYENVSIKAYAYYLASAWNWSAEQARVLELVFLVLFGLCLVAVIGRACARRESGLNPTLLLVSVIGALILPSVSNDYKLPLLTAPFSLILASIPWTDWARGRLRPLAAAALVGLASFAYWTVHYPAYRAKPEFLARNFPALLIILFVSIALYFFQREHVPVRSLS